MMGITKVLHKIQQELKAPKNQENTFGKYNYRSCEDILEAVKGLLPEGHVLTISDEIVMLGNRYYVKATAMLNDPDLANVTVTAYAREPENQKGMNEAQITGSASSYARKYALNGLFMIDDTKDPDATNKHEESAQTGRSTTNSIPIDGPTSKDSISEAQSRMLFAKSKSKGLGPEFTTNHFGVKELKELKRNEMNEALKRIDDYETETDINM